MKIKLLVLIGLIVAFSTCTNKNVNISFSQKECNNLVLSNSSYVLQNDMCNQTQGFINNTIRIKVQHNGKKACLEFFKINASFLYGDGTGIDSVQYKQDYKFSDSEVTLTDSYIEIAFNYTMNSQKDANDLRTVKIDLRLENELKDVSKLFTLTVPLSCASRSAGGHNFKTVQDVKVNNSTVSLSFRDYSSIDGDIITVYLNGVEVLSNLTLDGSYKTYVFTVNSGSNSLQVIAINEGSSSPNTCEVRVNGGAGIDLTPGLNTGQAINIIF